MEINLDKSYKHPLQRFYIIFGSEKHHELELNPGESFSVMFFPDPGGAHLSFSFDIENIRYNWDSWNSELFGKTFAHNFFEQHNRYEIFVYIKPDNTFFIRVMLNEGIFSKKMIVEGNDKIQYENILEDG